MKRIDPDKQPQVRGTRLGPDDEFTFRCHPGIKCFNKCCRNLNLFLYPYDVIRLRSNLGISSSEFLDNYTDVVLREGSHFPDVLLTMADNEEKTCPFLTPQGCTVYPDRPDTCRSFPVEQGLMYGEQGGKPTKIFFFRPPDFCRGPEEEGSWTVEDWLADQEAEVYSTMTALWAEIKALFIENPWGQEGPSGNRARMAFMAAYNIDDFRKFVLESTFLKRYKVKSQTVKKIKTDDDALLRLAFDWIKLFLFNMEGKRVRIKK